MGKKYVVSPVGSNWVVRKAGASRPSEVFSSKADAWVDARRRARGVSGEAVICERDGSIVVRNRYVSSESKRKQ